MAGSCVYGIKPSDFIKYWRFNDQPNKLLASQEELGSTELVTYLN
jgi:hypothetical protein